jgi:predicted component of type VI protein secretion system
VNTVGFVKTIESALVEQMQVKLKVLTGSHTGKDVPMSSDMFFIGRGDQCHLRPKSESVSRKHCVLVLREGRLLIQDLQSRNGTFVNDQRLAPDRARVLKPGDKIQVGKLGFEVLIDHALGGPKKPEVSGISEAAERVVAGADSRAEDVDVTSWLEEADQIERDRQLAAPETRQLRLDETHYGLPVDDSSEISVMEPAEPTARGVPEPGPAKKLPPGKLPKKTMAADSRDAAGQALKKFFGGR